MFLAASDSHLKTDIANGLAVVSFLIKYLCNLFRLLQEYLKFSVELNLSLKGESF